MNEYEKAIAEFTAKNAPTVCPPASSRADYKAARRESFELSKERVANNTAWYKAWANHADRNTDRGQMKTFTVSVEARPFGAIGLFSTFSFERTANTAEELMRKLYSEKKYDFRLLPVITENN